MDRELRFVRRWIMNGTEHFSQREFPRSPAELLFLCQVFLNFGLARSAPRQGHADIARYSARKIDNLKLHPVAARL